MQLRINFKIMFNDKWYDYTNISLRPWKSFPVFILQLEVSVVYSHPHKYSFAFFLLTGWNSSLVSNMKQFTFQF